MVIRIKWENEVEPTNDDVNFIWILVKNNQWINRMKSLNN
jgi:hypothetical protein